MTSGQGRMNPERDQHKYTPLNFDKGATAIQGKKGSLSTKGPRATGHPQAKVNLQFT